MLADIVCDRLEGFEVVFDLVDDGLVLEGAAVVLEVHFLRLLGKELQLATGVVVTFLKGLEGGGSLPTESEGAGDLDPVDFESGAALLPEFQSVVVRKF